MHTANPARVYDYFLGGRDSFEPDRRAAEEALAVAPELRAIAKENRAFLSRAVRYLVRAGVRQFIDIGTGMPRRGSVHEVAQEVAPETRVVYVDNDPVVLVHARALLTAREPGTGPTVAVDGDVRDPLSIMCHPEVLQLIDFARPLAVMLFSVLQFVPDQDPAEIIAPLRDVLPPDGHLVLSHPTHEVHGDQAARVADAYRRCGIPTVTRGKGEIERALDGFDVLEPGVVQAPLWRPDGEVTPDLDHIWMYGAAARKR